MLVVAIHHWAENDPDVVQRVAQVLGVSAFDARQRMVGGGPVVVAKFADPQAVAALESKLERAGVPAVVVDREELRSRTGPFPVRQFALTESGLQFESAVGETGQVDYREISLLLTARAVVSFTETTTTTTRRQFSLGTTVLAGGIPMTKKVKEEITHIDEERDEVLCLYAADRSFLLRRWALNYEGLGSAMQLTRELNFAFLKAELRRRAPRAVFDDRLLKPAGRARLLGAGLDPNTHLDLAFEILARTLV